MPMLLLLGPHFSENVNLMMLLSKSLQWFPVSPSINSKVLNEQQYVGIRVFAQTCPSGSFSWPPFPGRLSWTPQATKLSFVPLLCAPVRQCGFLCPNTLRNCNHVLTCHVLCCPHTRSGLWKAPPTPVAPHSRGRRSPHRTSYPFI